jgi:hypothetical protein
MKVKYHIGESALNPADIHGDYTAKSKTLQDLSRDKHVDQQQVQQRKLDLEKEYALKKEKLKADHEKNKEKLQQEEVKEPTGDLKDACWTGYTAVGMKMKNGKKVPNCVPVKEELDEEHIVHVDDGSKYGEEPHDKDVEHVMSGAKTHGGEFDGHSDKGAYFKFKSHTDARNFADHVKRAPHKSVHADLHEETDLEESRGHKIIATKLKNIETARKAFSGEKPVCPQCGKHECACGEQRPGISTDSTMSKDPFFKEDFSEEEIDEMVNSVTDQDIEDLYEEDEIVLVYDDDGEEIPPLQEESKYDLMEVLSRTERMRGKLRLRKTSAKRGRSTKIALKRYSNPATINKRARRLAIKLMKKRMLRGRDYSKVSVGEKERIEKTLSQRKDVISRVAQKLVSRVRKVEKARMSHGKVTKGAMPSVF